MDNQEVLNTTAEETIITEAQEVTEQQQDFTNVKPDPHVIGFFTQSVDEELFNEIKAKPEGIEQAQEYARNAVITVLFNNLAGACEERGINPATDKSLDDFIDRERFDTIVKPQLIESGLTYVKRTGRDRRTGNIIENYEIEDYIDSNNNPLELTKVTFCSPDFAIAVLSMLYAQVANHTHRTSSLAHAYINEYMHVHCCDTYEDLLAAREVYQQNAQEAAAKLAEAKEKTNAEEETSDAGESQSGETTH